jgi:hypothetical protein
MPAAKSAVMARLDQAIYERGKNFNCLLDGRLKPGHDNEANGSYFHTRDGGGELLNLLRL